MDAVPLTPPVYNEPVLDYAPGSAERAELRRELARCAGEQVELPLVIGGEPVTGSGPPMAVRRPDRHAQVLATARCATAEDTEQALRAARAAAPGWRELPFEDRAAVLLRAAALLAGPWRQRLNAVTMLGQGKTVVQAEIDAACELIDFWRFNVTFAHRLLAEQPESSAPGTWNRLDHRPLEGFVYAITPFNFTSIAGNLPTAPALLGNVVLWKPAPTQTLAAVETLRLLEAAGLPPGVVNLVTGPGPEVSRAALAAPDLAGIHFTGSTATFTRLWRQVAVNLDRYRSFPRLVGETGGKNYLLAHPSADPEPLVTALVRGAFEYAGQKCSAVSRAYLPASLWPGLRDRLAAVTEGLRCGPVDDLSSFLGPVIDAAAHRRLTAALDRARGLPGVELLAGGSADAAEGWFVRPTVLRCDDPTDELFRTEYFGPLLAVHVYPDADWERMLTHLDAESRYGLTGAVHARDRVALAQASRVLRFTAGNFYLNDKPTGAVVGRQPFGGGRRSGTNDKAGAVDNLRRWTSSRALKETFLPPTGHGYPAEAPGS